MNRHRLAVCTHTHQRHTLHVKCMNQTRMLHNKNCHSCPVFAATTHSLGTGITYVRLPSESKTSGGSVVRAFPKRNRCLCDSAARSQRMSLSLSLSTCMCHPGMVHSHLHGMHLHIQSLTPAHMSKKTSHGKTGMRLPRMLHSKQQRLPILNTPHTITHAHLTKNR